MSKYFDIELFGYQHIDSGWWNITFFRIASANWSWHLFMVEENRDECFVQWFTFTITK